MISLVGWTFALGHLRMVYRDHDDGGLLLSVGNTLIRIKEGSVDFQ